MSEHLDKRAESFANEMLTKLAFQHETYTRTFDTQKAVWSAIVDAYRKGHADGVAAATRRESPPEEGKGK